MPPKGSRWARHNQGDWRYALSRLPDEDVIDHTVETVFLTGQCHALAYALWVLYSRPVVGVGVSQAPSWPGPAHFGNIMQDGRVLDVQGPHDPGEWAAAWGGLGSPIIYVPELLLLRWVEQSDRMYRPTKHAFRFADALMDMRPSKLPAMPSRPPEIYLPGRSGLLTSDE